MSASVSVICDPCYYNFVLYFSEWIGSFSFLLALLVVLLFAKAAVNMMKCRKAAAPGDIPKQVWRCVVERGKDFVTRLCNTIEESERMPEE